MADEVRWGILGTGNVARRFATSLAKVSGATLSAVAGRTPERAASFAREFGGRALTSYEELLADDEIDGVYLALPHGLHAFWAMCALKAKKPVLCEKPAATSCAQALQITTAAEATNTLFVEAMKPRFQPAWSRICELVSSGELGELRAIDVRLAMRYPSDREGYFVDPTQGGVLLDLGGYCASWLDAFTKGDPHIRSLSHKWQGAIDIADSCELLLDDVACHLAVSAEHDESRATLVFSHGSVEAWPLHRPTRYAVRFDDGSVEERDVPTRGDDFTGEIEQVSALIASGASESSVMPRAATVRCARIVDACRSGFDRLGVALRLAELCGQDAVFLNEPMADHTSFEVGGPADVYVEPPSVVKLQESLSAIDAAGAQAVVVGKGSDLLVADSGFRGVIVSTQRLQTLRVDMNYLEPLGIGRVIADAGASLADLANAACEAGLGGLEFASGIPGSVGGAIYMNAGAYDGCIADVVETVVVRLPDGQVTLLMNRDLDFGYRKSRVRAEHLTVLMATFALKPRDPALIRARMDELAQLRAEKQPLDVPSAGSTFKRPPGHFAGKLIADAGLKGKRVGGAQISPKHAGFVVNAKNATAGEINELIEYVIKEVKRQFGVTLEPEVQRIGRF